MSGYSLVATCPVHGDDVVVFALGGKNFCEQCVADHLTKHCTVIEMKEVTTAPPKLARRKAIEGAPWEHHYICPKCQHTWKAELGVACPMCGADAKE